MANQNIYNPKTGQTGYQVPGAAPPSGWLPIGSSPAPLVKDPASGMFSSTAGTTGPNMVPVTTNSNPSGTTSVGLSPKVDPYNTFNQNVATILKQIQGAQVSGNANLTGAKNFLTTESVNPNNSTFDPSVFSGSQVQGQETLQKGFEPAVTSINDQLVNTNRSLDTLGSNLSTMANTMKPEVISAGQSLVTKDGTVLQRAPSYLPPQIRPDTGNLDSFDQANGVWRSDVMNGSTGGKTSVADNNNPLNIKLTGTTTKMFEALGISTGSAATDGGNFVHFNNPADGIKGARLLLQSPLYANDSVDQALKAWSNNGYDSSILSDTGINPHALVKNLDPVQLDTMMTAMRKAEGGVQNQNISSPTSGLAPNVQQDASDLAAGKVAPQILAKRYTDAYGKDGGTLYNLAVQAAKKINPLFDETAANLKYAGQQTQTENLNSGNPITSLFSNLKNAVTTPATLNLLNPSKPTSGKTSSGMGYTVLP